MGVSSESQRLSDATGRSAVDPDAARPSVTSWLRDRRGVTAIEYGLMVGLMTIVIIGAVYTLGNQTFTQLFEKIANSLP
jgi:pilus assembly protein Flp/PilA